MDSIIRCAVCGIHAQVVVGPDEICYCSACYQMAYPNTLWGQRHSAARQRRILELARSKIRQPHKKVRLSLLH